MSTLIPTAYMIQFGGLPGTVVEVLMDGDGWSAHKGELCLSGWQGRLAWEYGGSAHIFETAREAADTAEHTY